MMTFFRFFVAWATTKWAKWRGYAILASPDEQNRRWQVCTGCPEFKDQTCGACGCLVMAKIMLNTEKCPKNYWPRRWERR